MPATTGSNYHDSRFKSWVYAQWKADAANVGGYNPVGDGALASMVGTHNPENLSDRKLADMYKDLTGNQNATLDDAQNAWAKEEGYKDFEEAATAISESTSGGDKNKGGLGGKLDAAGNPTGGAGAGAGAGAGGGGTGGGSGGGPGGSGGGGGFAGGGAARGPMPLTGFNGGVANAPVTGYGPVIGGGAPNLGGVNSPIPGIDPSLLDTPGIPGYGGLPGGAGGGAGGGGGYGGGSGGSGGTGGNGGEYGSQGGAGTSEDALRLIREQQAATDQANRKNELRYENIKGRYQDRYDRNLASLEGYGDSMRTDIARQGDRNRASYDQDLIDRGLGNTTVRTSAQRGANEDELRANVELEDSITRNKINLDSQLMKDKLDFMERREDVGPDNAMFAQLLQQYGASGANNGTGTGGGAGTGTGTGTTGGGTGGGPGGGGTPAGPVFTQDGGTGPGPNGYIQDNGGRPISSYPLQDGSPQPQSLPPAPNPGQTTTPGELEAKYKASGKYPGQTTTPGELQAKYMASGRYAAGGNGFAPGEWDMMAQYPDTSGGTIKQPIQTMPVPDGAYPAKRGGDHPVGGGLYGGYVQSPYGGGGQRTDGAHAKHYRDNPSGRPQGGYGDTSDESWRTKTMPVPDGAINPQRTGNRYEDTINGNYGGGGKPWHGAELVSVGMQPPRWTGGDRSQPYVPRPKGPDVYGNAPSGPGTYTPVWGGGAPGSAGTYGGTAYTPGWGGGASQYPGTMAPQRPVRPPTTMQTQGVKPMRPYTTGGI